MIDPQPNLLEVADLMIEAIKIEIKENPLIYRKYPAKVTVMIENLERVTTLIRSEKLNRLE